MRENLMMPPENDDQESLMDQCALECMNAIEMKDKTAFREAFHVLIADLINKLSMDMEKE